MMEISRSKRTFLKSFENSFACSDIYTCYLVTKKFNYFEACASLLAVVLIVSRCSMRSSELHGIWAGAKRTETGQVKTSARVYYLR